MSAPSRTTRMVHTPHGRYASAKWVEGGDLGVATSFRSKSQIRFLGYSLTLVYALDIGFEVRVRLSKVLDTQNRPTCGPASICVDGSYLIKDFIKYVLTLKLNIHHALNEKSTHNMLNITSQQK